MRRIGWPVATTQDRSTESSNLRTGAKLRRWMSVTPRLLSKRSPDVAQRNPGSHERHGFIAVHKGE